MTTERDDLKDREERFGTGYANSQGTATNAFADPSKQFPSKHYENQPNTNESLRSGRSHTLPLGADIDLPPIASTQYPYADVKETVSGHVIEFNDTPGGERILIKHNTGSGIELRPDGTVVVLATTNKVEVTHGDQTVIVEGNGQLTYEGDLTINVKGDFKVNCDSYEVNAKNDKVENISGNSRTKVFGNEGKTVSGNSSNTVVGTTVNTHLGNVTTAIKGTNKQATEGSHIIAASDKLELTAETRIIQSSPKINTQSDEMFIWSDTGTIGGVEMRIHGQGAHFSEGVTAPTFHGDLQGTAVQAITADVTNSQNYSDPDTDPGSAGNTGSAQGYTAENIAQPAVFTAPSGVVTDVLNKSALGVKKVKVDVDDFLKNSLRLRPLAVTDVRSKLRDPSYLNDAEFTATQIGNGNLNPAFAQQSPPNGYGRIRNAQGGTHRGTETIGNTSPERSTKTFTIPKRKQRFTLSDSAYGEMDARTIIGTGTRVTDRVGFARFVGAEDGGAFKNLSLADKKQIGKNYIAQVNLTKIAMGTNGQFASHRLKVVEGFYAKELYGKGTPQGLQAETLTPNGLLDLRNKGRAVVYELYGPDGKMDTDATFDLAVELSDMGMFDKLVLDYDNFAADGSMNVQIIVEMPNITGETVTFKRIIETKYNNIIQATDSLVELKAEPQ